MFYALASQNVVEVRPQNYCRFSCIGSLSFPAGQDQFRGLGGEKEEARKQKEEEGDSDSEGSGGGGGGGGTGARKQCLATRHGVGY